MNQQMSERMCSRKRQYRERRAWEIAKRMRSRDELIHAYHCFICGYWHIGNDAREARQFGETR